jgi:hypothetical protein
MPPGRHIPPICQTRYIESRSLYQKAGTSRLTCKGQGRCRHWVASRITYIMACVQLVHCDVSDTTTLGQHQRVPQLLHSESHGLLQFLVLVLHKLVLAM